MNLSHALRGLAGLMAGLCFLVGDARSQAPALALAPKSSNGHAEEGPRWLSLTPAQRLALAPLERDWTAIDAPHKAKWLELVVRYAALPPSDQSRMQERMVEWARLTPAERGRARLTFQETKQLSAQEKQERWNAYKSLPDAQRQALAQRGKVAAERPVAAVSTPVPMPRTLLSPPAPIAAALAKAAQPAASAVHAKAVGPTTVQAKPGATTTLMTKAPVRPAHQQPGQAQIEAQPGKVDPATLLPRSGPQAPAAAGTAKP